MQEKVYKEPNKSETETSINVLYNENILSVYTNKVSLQKQLNRIIGEPTKEYKIKRSIAGSRWNISLDDKSKIAKMILKANIFEVQHRDEEDTKKGIKKYEEKV